MKAHRNSYHSGAHRKKHTEREGGHKKNIMLANWENSKPNKRQREYNKKESQETEMPRTQMEEC